MASPPAKRIKLDFSPSLTPEAEVDIVQSGDAELEDDTSGEHCSICLQPYSDRTMIPTCSHEFCFECLLIWTEQSRRCPLCSQNVGNYLMHHIRGKYDYQKYYLTPLRTSPAPQNPAAVRADARRRAERRRNIEWGRRRRREVEEADELERAIEKRRWVYRHKLYAKHVASNPYTRYRPFPTPAQFAASQDFTSRATVFVRRELRVWVGLDVEFLTTFTVSLMKSLDIRSEPAVRLLSEFLDMDAESGHERANAEHFAHELYCYLRSPYRDLSAYDNNAQYDVPATVPPPDAPQPQRRRRWRSPSQSSLRSRSRSPGLLSRRSPSPRRRPPTSRSSSLESSPWTNRRRASPYGRDAADQDTGPSRGTRNEDGSHRNLRRRSRSGSSGPGGSPRPSDHRQITPGRDLHVHGDVSKYHRDRYHGKGKSRAEDDCAASSSRHRSSSRPGSAIAVGGGDHAGMQSPVNGGSVFRSAHQNDLPGPAQSTPPHATNRPAGISRSAVTGGGDPQAVIEGELDSDHRSKVSTEACDGAGLPTSTGASTQEKPSVRIRRSAWQTMQEHLAGGGKESRLRKHREEASAPDLVSPQEHRDRSQVSAKPASVPRDQALSPEAAPAHTTDDAVPSLLLRLSDPVPNVSVHPQNANTTDGGPGARRGTLSARKGGKGISVPDITTRTRARSARTSAGEDRSAASQLPPSTHDPGAAGCDSSAKHVAGGTGDVGPMAAVEHMSPASEGPAAQPEAGPGRGAQTATGSGATSSDPRFLLVQKLKVEKRKARASAVPTAEKTQLCPPAGGSTPGDGGNPSVPMGLLSDGTRGRLTKPAPAGVEVVAAARNAERREAELRSQAQLRVRLAATKRAAVLQANAAASRTSAAASGSGSDFADESTSACLVSQEDVLKNRLRARRA